MKPIFNDLIFWGSVAAILVCAAGLYWAINAYRNLGGSAKEDDLPPLDLEQDAPVELPMPGDEHAEPELSEGLEPAFRLETPATRPIIELPKPTPPLKMPTPITPSAALPNTPSVSAGGNAPNGDVVNRLEVMNQRLAEMHSVLSKQAAGGMPPSVGQGFSPETIDKLLRIIGNVVIQVEILQRSYTPGGEPAKNAAAGAAAGQTTR